MNILDRYIPEKELALEYNSAKIIANPYDYKLSERLFVCSIDEIYSKYDIYNKTNGSEWYLTEKLGLDTEISDVEYLRIRDDVEVSNDLKQPADITTFTLDSECGCSGTFIKYNNLVLNDEILIKDLASDPHIPDALSDKGFVLSIKRNGYLKALEILSTLMTRKSSIIPSLMYLVTEFNDRSLDDIENIQFAVERLENNKHILLDNFRYYNEPEEMTRDVYLPAAYLPIWTIASSPYYMMHSMHFLFASENNIGNSFYRLGLLYSIIYGTEILYLIENIKDADVKYTLKELLKHTYSYKGFCERYLYTVCAGGEILINPEIKACFDDDNEIRFNNIRNYLNKIIKDVDITSKVTDNLEYYRLPIMFARMVQNAHTYAYQVARVKHATLLYSEAKRRGLIDPNDFKMNGTSGGGIFSSADADDDLDYSDNPSDLLNLGSMSYDEDSGSESEFDVEKEKEVFKKRKDTPPALNAMDALKKDLENSRYSFDVTFVKHPMSYKDSYSNIASSIKLITNELTRQIKEIRTYNTGGKQNGLLVGKLDKKNLWKYKSDHRIFCNNNYKLKEMDLAFGCILDESGSMYGEKIKNGRIVMIMLHEVLTSLGVNHSIIGHTSNDMYQCKIFKYYQFKEEQHYTLDKPYGLVCADNRRGNCDSGALYYMQSVMKSVRNKDKIVIIFSDGQPTECTELDLTEQVKNMERNGIHVIGVGINFDSIKEYYPDNANGKNLKEMVDIVVSILKRYVLEKKED